MINEEKLFKLLPYFLTGPRPSSWRSRKTRTGRAPRNWPSLSKGRPWKWKTTAAVLTMPGRSSASRNRTGPPRSWRTKCPRAGASFF